MILMRVCFKVYQRVSRSCCTFVDLVVPSALFILKRSGIIHGQDHLLAPPLASCVTGRENGFPRVVLLVDELGPANEEPRCLLCYKAHDARWDKYIQCFFTRMLRAGPRVEDVLMIIRHFFL